MLNRRARAGMSGAMAPASCTVPGASNHLIAATPEIEWLGDHAQAVKGASRFFAFLASRSYQLHKDFTLPSHQSPTRAVHLELEPEARLGINTHANTLPGPCSSRCESTIYLLKRQAIVQLHADNTTPWAVRCEA